MTHSHKWPGSSSEIALAENLVAQTGGHFVTIVRQGVGELLGVNVRGRTVVIRDMLEVYAKAYVEEIYNPVAKPSTAADIFHDAEGRN